MASVKETLTKIQVELKAPKSQYNSFGKYNYRSCEDILEGVKPLLLKYGCTLVLSNDIITIGDRYYIKSIAKFWYGDEAIEVTAYAREDQTKKGMDVAQVTGAAISYCNKYCLNNLFLIDDTKDVDSQDNTKQSSGNSNKQTITGPGAFIIRFGKKYKGKCIADVPRADLEATVEWLEKQDKLTDGAKAFIENVEKYLGV